MDTTASETVLLRGGTHDGETMTLDAAPETINLDREGSSVAEEYVRSVEFEVVDDRELQVYRLRAH
jgi:hypothetical protein